jgi:hypothetical protein
MDNQEAVLAIVTDDFDTTLQPKVAFKVVFGDAGPMSGQEVIPVLNDFMAIADRIVLGFEAETKRILGA